MAWEWSVRGNIDVTGEVRVAGAVSFRDRGGVGSRAQMEGLAVDRCMNHSS